MFAFGAVKRRSLGFILQHPRLNDHDTSERVDRVTEEMIETLMFNELCWPVNVTLCFRNQNLHDGVCGQTGKQHSGIGRMSYLMIFASALSPF